MDENEYKLILYTEDAMLILTKPRPSLQAAVACTDMFSIVTK